MLTKQDRENNFAADLKKWKVIHTHIPPNNNSETIDSELYNILLNGYKRLVTFAEELGKAREAEKNKPYEEKKYWARPNEDGVLEYSNRLKMRMAVEADGLLSEIRNAAQVMAQSDPDEAAGKLRGSIIRAAAVDGERLGYIISATHLIAFDPEDRKAPGFTDDIIKQIRGSVPGNERK